MTREGTMVAAYKLTATAPESWPGATFYGLSASQEPVTLKQLQRDELHLTREHWDAFCHYLSTLPSLEHPHLETVLGLHQSPQNPDEAWLISRRNPPPKSQLPATLLGLLQGASGERLNARNARATILQVLRGAEYLHDLGEVHRGIHPAAIALDWGHRPPHAQLSQVGLTWFMQEATTSFPNHILPYIAPEVRDAPHLPFHPNQDIYAIGALFWRLLTGASPPLAYPYVHDPSRPEELPWPWPLNKAHGLDQRLCGILAMMLEPVPTRRAGHAHEILQAFSEESAPPPLRSRKHDDDVYGTLPYFPMPHQTLVTPSQPQQDTPLEGKKTLPYQMDLEAALSSMHKKLTASLPPQHTDGSSYDGLLAPIEPPEPIPESWEREAIKQDNRLAARFRMSIRPWLLWLLLLPFVWWACQSIWPS